MDIVISGSSGEPIYQQIVNQIKTLIACGKMQERDMMPSIRQLAKDLRISVITTKRAYEDLEREGFIISIPGKGSYVAPYNREIQKESQLKMMEKELTEVIRKGRLLNLDLEDIIGIIRQIDGNMES